MQIKGNPPLTIGCQLPENGMYYQGMFYFNILGSMDKNDIKLIAMINDNNEKTKFIFLNNENKTWQNMKDDKQWIFPIQNYISDFGIDYWVCVFFCMFVCLLRYFVKT